MGKALKKYLNTNEEQNCMNKKLLFVTARLPYPASSGRKNVMYNYCKILHEKYGFEIYVASFLEDGDIVNPIPDFISNVNVLNDLGAKKKIKNLVKKTFLTKQYPMQISLFYDDVAQKKIDEYIDTIKPNIVMADMVRTSEYLRNCSRYKVADLDDMLSIRYERQLENDISGINPYGAYLYSLPKIIQSILSLTCLKKYILKNEIRLLKRYEREVSLDYNKILFVAQHEADILNKEMNFNKALGVPLGVDLNFYGEFFKKIEVKDYTIAFLGAMSVAHNETGALHFINDIFPLIKKENPKSKFIVVGGGVTQKVKDAAKNNESIIFTGRVDDIRSYVGACSVFVCPLTFGSGIKTKNLEAMAMGVPVVTTSIGAENINAKDGEEWLVADDNQQFAQAVLAIFNDKKLHDMLQNNGYEFVKNNFTWKVAEEKFGFLEEI